MKLLKTNGASNKKYDKLRELPVDCLGSSKVSSKIYELVKVRNYQDMYYYQENLEKSFYYTETKESDNINDEKEDEKDNNENQKHKRK